MKSFLLHFSLIAGLAGPAFGSGQQAITGVNIFSNGWWANVYISNIGSNNTASFGLGTNNTPVNPTFTLTVRDPGFDTNGNVATLTRVVYGTALVRMPYPNPQFMTIWPNGSGQVVNVALSEQIFAGSTVTGCNILAGFYQDRAGNSNAPYLGTVTNSATEPYPKVLANNRDVPWTMVGSNYTLHVIAAHYSAAFTNLGLPVACIKGWATDTAGHWTSTNQGICGIDLSEPNAMPVTEMLIPMTYANLKPGFITNYFAAWPHAGTAAEVCRSDDGANSLYSRYYKPLVLWYDPTNSSLPLVIALVDRTNGTPAGVCATNYLQATNGFAKPFDRISRAMLAIAATNKFFYGSNTLANGQCWLTNGSYDIFGGDTVSGITEMKTYVTITSDPRSSPSKVNLCSNYVGQTMGHQCKVKVSNLTINWTNNSLLFNQGFSVLWFDNCTIQTNTGSSGILFKYNTNTFITHCLFQNYRYGLQAADVYVDQMSAAWGNTFVGGARAKNSCAVFAGNVVSNLYGATSWLYDNSGAGTVVNPCFFVCNALFNEDSSAGPVLNLFLNCWGTNGCVIYNNLIETTQPQAGGVCWDVLNSSPTGETCTNFLNWCNTILGRYHPPFEYGDQGTNQTMFCYQNIGNIFCEGVRSDIGSPINPFLHTNRWQLLYGVGQQGNANFPIAGAGIRVDVPAGTSGFSGANYGFEGLGSYLNTNANIGSAVPGFVSNAVYNGSPTTGQGDYRLRTDSPLLFNLSTPWVLKYDLRGFNRAPGDNPGALVTRPRAGLALSTL